MCATHLTAQNYGNNLPKAEWDSAKLILMHTPGQELFDGVIHPAAGLFEDYFDVDKAADEHRSYIGMLRENGIRVLTVDGILNEIDIDSLRTLASELLKKAPRRPPPAGRP